MSRCKQFERVLYFTRVYTHTHTHIRTCQTHFVQQSSLFRRRQRTLAGKHFENRVEPTSDVTFFFFYFVYYRRDDIVIALESPRRRDVFPVGPISRVRYYDVRLLSRRASTRHAAVENAKVVL